MIRRNLFISLVVFLTLWVAGSEVYATDVSGDQTGVWKLDESPYLLVGDVRVPPGQTLAIEPGVVIRAQGHYRITVDQGTLLATGSPGAPILMTAADPITGWRGIRLETAHDDTVIEYCVVEYAIATGGFPEASGGALMIEYCSPRVYNNVFRFNRSHAEYENGAGGGIFAQYSSAAIVNNLITQNSADNGGGIFLNEATPTIRGNVITENSAARGGGIYLGARSAPLIEYNMVARNESYGQYGGGGINSWTDFIFSGTFATIRNNVIVYNTSTQAGGGLYCRYDRAVITNNLIAYNSASEGGGIYALNLSAEAPQVTNCIIWGNAAATGKQVHLEGATGSAISIKYSAVEAGWADTGNIDQLPAFVDVDGPDDVPGSDDDDFRLSPLSPCIDAGDPGFAADSNETDIDGNPRIVDGDDDGSPVVDMGPYEFQPAVVPAPVPAVSQWGLIVMGLLVLTAGTLAFIRGRPAVVQGSR